MTELDDMVPEWSTFCLYLGVQNTTIKKIQQENMTPRKCTVLMLEAWIAEKGEQATIQDILKALESPTIANPALSHRLQKENKFIQKMLKRKPPSSCG